MLTDSTYRVGCLHSPDLARGKNLLFALFFEAGGRGKSKSLYWLAPEPQLSGAEVEPAGSPSKARGEQRGGRAWCIPVAQGHRAQLFHSPVQRAGQAQAAVRAHWGGQPPYLI